MVQIGAAHTRQEIDQALVFVVGALDQVKARCEAIAQWGATQTADGLAVAWGIDVGDAQGYLDACATFGKVVDDALIADPKLGPLAASIRGLNR